MLHIDSDYEPLPHLCVARRVCGEFPRASTHKAQCILVVKIVSLCDPVVVVGGFSTVLKV